MDLSTLSKLRHSHAKIIFVIKLPTTFLITIHIIRTVMQKIVQSYAVTTPAVIIKIMESIIFMHASQ